MARCIHCGKWVGLFDHAHVACEIAVASGEKIDDIRYASIPASSPLTAIAIFWAVFWALWAFGISAALVVFLLRLAFGDFR